MPRIPESLSLLQMRKRVVIIGSTGSIGRQALEVIRRFPDRFEVVGLVGGANADLLAEQALEFRPKLVGIASKEQVQRLEQLLPSGWFSLVGGGDTADIAAHPGADLVLLAAVGLAGLKPALAAVKAGKALAVANKESIVAAGHIIAEEAAKSGAILIPVDSEHSAVFQCLLGERKHLVRRIILTASGGAFRDRPLDQLSSVTPEEALAHPTWKMGKKVTVDSATLMNKGLEVIEAHRLFDIPVGKIETVLHHQSIVHSLVEFTDGSMKAQMSLPDMRIPIEYALFYPERGDWAPTELKLWEVGCLTFAALDMSRYPCLGLAYEAAKMGGTAPAVLSAADEVAVSAFLEGRLRFTNIAVVLEETLSKHTPWPACSIEDVMCADTWARDAAEACVSRREVSNARRS